jgi:hypothetical protein
VGETQAAPDHRWLSDFLSRLQIGAPATATAFS